MSPATTRRLLHDLRRLFPASDHSPASDQQLLDRFTTARDESAFAALLERHGPMVLGVCRRVLGDVAAEDTFQATFLALVRQAASIRHETIGGWLYAVAHRLALRARTDEARRRRREQKAASALPHVTQADAGWQELLGVLDEELRQLPELLRAPLLACYLEGRTQDEAARQLGWSLSTLRRRLERGRAVLHRRLTQRGATLSAALFAGLLAPHAVTASVPERLASATLRAVLAVRASGVFHASLVALTALLTVAGALAYQATAERPSPPSPPPAKAATADEKEPGVDGLGDPLPPGAVARLGTTRLRHGWRLSCAAIAPNGRTVLSGSPYDSALRLWDTATGRHLRVVGHHPGIKAVAFTPDGKTVVSGGGDAKVRLWDVATGKIVRTFSAGRETDVMTIALAPDGKALAAAGHFLRVWDIATGRTVLEVPPLEKGICSLAFSHDGKLLAGGGGDREVVVWDVANGKERARWKGHDNMVMAVAFLPDGKSVVSGGWDGSLRLWDVANRKALGLLGKHQDSSPLAQNSILALAVSPDGKTLVSGGHTLTVLQWDIAARKEMRRLGQHLMGVAALAFSRDGKTVVTAGETIRLWNPATGKERCPLPGHAASVESVALSPDGKVLASAGIDGTVRFWDLAAVREVGRIDGVANGIEGAFWGVRFAPDGKTVATTVGDFGPVIHLWDVASGKLVRRFTWPAYRANSLAFSPDGKLLAAGTDEWKVHVWDTATGQKRWAFGEKSFTVRALAFSPDGRFLAAAGVDNIVRLLESGTGRKVRRFGEARPDHRNDLIESRDVAFSPDSSLLAVGSGDGSVYLWDVATGKERGRLRGERGSVNAVAFSHDGRTLATAGWDRKVRIWDLATGRQRIILDGHRSPATSVAFTPDSRRLISGSTDTTALVWDLTTLGKSGEIPTAAEFARAWDDLAALDPEPAYRAAVVLSVAPERSVPWLRQRLRPVVVADRSRTAQLIDDLKSDKYTVRERAGKELEGLAEGAAPALRKVLKGAPSLELRRRVERLLGKLEEKSPERLRDARAVEVLERSANEKAVALLRTLASGVSEALLTREAQAALHRLETRRTGR